MHQPESNQDYVDELLHGIQYEPPLRLPENAMEDPIFANRRVIRNSASWEVLQELGADSTTLDALRMAKHEVKGREEVKRIHHLVYQTLRKGIEQGKIEPITPEVNRAIQDRADELARDHRQAIEAYFRLEDALRPLLPVVNIEEDCDRDRTDSGEYISSISWNELIPEKTVKLSDGHCYNEEDILGYYKSQLEHGWPFESPFTHEPFTEMDIQQIQERERRRNRYGGGRR